MPRSPRKAPQSAFHRNPGSEPGWGHDELELIVESSFAARLLVNGDGRIVYVNKAAEEAFGYRAEELAGANVDVLMPPALRLEGSRFREAFLADPRRVMIGLDREIHAARKNGAEFPVHIGLAPIRTEDSRLFIAVTVFDISHHKAIEAELRDRAEKLEQANDRLARFAYIASHDLQEPLRKIATFVEIMKSALAEGKSDEALHAGDVIRTSALRSRELVEGLLTYSRHVSTPLELEDIDVKKEIEAVVADFSELIRETRASVSVTVPAGTRVRADKPQFVRCFYNLLSNSFKYRKPGRDLEILLKATNDREVRISVVDNGIGFEPKYAQIIFKPLERLHSFSQYPGTGIGLALCKAMCDRHGWGLEAESQLGMGASFTMVVPPAEQIDPL